MYLQNISKNNKFIQILNLSTKYRITFRWWYGSAGAGQTNEQIDYYKTQYTEKIIFILKQKFFWFWPKKMIFMYNPPAWPDLHICCHLFRPYNIQSNHYMGRAYLTRMCRVSLAVYYREWARNMKRIEVTAHTHTDNYTFSLFNR